MVLLYEPEDELMMRSMVAVVIDHQQNANIFHLSVACIFGIFTRLSFGMHSSMRSCGANINDKYKLEFGCMFRG